MSKKLDEKDIGGNWVDFYPILFVLREERKWKSKRIHVNQIAFSSSRNHQNDVRFQVAHFTKWRRQ